MPELPDSAIEAIAYNDEHLPFFAARPRLGDVRSASGTRDRILGAMATATAESGPQASTAPIWLSPRILADRAPLRWTMPNLYTQVSHAPRPSFASQRTSRGRVARSRERDHRPVTARASGLRKRGGGEASRLPSMRPCSRRPPSGSSSGSTVRRGGRACPVDGPAGSESPCGGR